MSVRCALLLLLIGLVGCAKNQPPPWLTSVRVTGPNPRPGLFGLTDDSDLPPIGPHLTEGFARRRTLWAVRDEIRHPWSRWWQFIPVAPTVLGYTRSTVDFALLDADTERVAAFFAEHGWRNASVELTLQRPRLWIARLLRSRKRDRTLEANFQVQVGTRSTIESLTLFGDPVDVSLPNRKYGVGAPWGLQTERDLLSMLQYTAEMDGHGLAAIDLRQESDANGATRLEVDIDRGPEVVFGELTFAGNRHLSDTALRRAAGRAVAEGLSWSPRRMDRLERRMRRMPGVDGVVVTRRDPVDTSDGRAVPVDVTITEADRDVILPANEIIGRPGTLTLIVGATWIRRDVLGRNSWTRVHAAGGYRHIWRDVWGGDSGPAGALGLGLDASLEPSGALFLHTSVDATVDQWHGYHFLRGDGEVGPRWARGPVSLWAGYRATEFLAFPFPLQRPTFERYFETADDANAPVERDYLLHQSVLHLELDTIEDPINPKQGARLSLDAIPYGRVEGATVRRIAGDVDTYWPTPYSLLTMRVRVGAGLLEVDRSDGSDVGVLLGHRMFSGGPSLVRGWVDRGILPPGTDWEPGTPRLGGNAEGHATLEPRFHIHPHATFTPFLDAASTWNEPGDVDIATLRWSTGAGLRFPMIIGEGHLLFAWIVGNPQQELDPGRFRIHLTLDGY